YYNNKASFEEADPVTLAGGETKANINAALKAGGQISGKVTDSVSKAPLESAFVCATAESISRCATTNSSGEYTIVALPNGKYVVSFSRFEIGRASCRERVCAAEVDGEVKRDRGWTA